MSLSHTDEFMDNLMNTCWEGRIIDIRILRDGIELPAPQTPGSAAVDLQAAVDESIVLHPGQCERIPTGIAIHIENSGLAGFVYGRSGMGLIGVRPANCVGVIDSDYQGEITVAMINDANETRYIQPGQRIAQLVIAPVFTPQWRLVESFKPSVRGSGGFGSTGN